MSFDLGKTNLNELSEAGHEFELRLPQVNEPTGAFIKVRGSQSPSVKKFAKRKFAEQQQKEMVAKRKNRELDPPSIEDLEEMAVESAAVRVISWRGITKDGVDVDCTPENIRSVLAEHSWIRDAVIEESDMLSNFIPS